MSRASIFALVVVFLGLAGQAAGQEKQAPVVAVFEIENRDSPLTDKHMITLTEYLGTKLGEQGRYRIIPRQEIRARLLEQKKESYKECFDQSCQIEIGRELAAEFTVSTTIGKIGDLCLITASLYDLRKAATDKTATAKSPCEVNDLVNAIEQVADKLQAEPTVTEPEPDLKDLKTPDFSRPAITYKKAPAGPMLSDTFSDVHLVFSYPLKTTGDLINPESLHLGIAASLDFRLTDWFTLGPFFRFTFMEYMIIEASVRTGFLFEISRTFYVHPYILGGFTFEEVRLDYDSGSDVWDLVGFHVRGGLGLKWMFGRDFGACIDVLAGWSTGVAIEDQVEGADGQAVELAFNFGMVVGW
jgi:hypothetical protein